MTKAEANEAFVRAYQASKGLKVDGWAGKDTLSTLTRSENVSDILGKSNTIPDDYWPMLAKIESGNRPYIKASTSSASGLYQFIKSTWVGEGGRWGSDPTRAFGGLLTTPDEQLMRAKSFTQKNADALVRAGIPVNKASLYAAHFLGVGTAVKIIGADVNASAEVLAGPAATKANPSILKGKTVAQFLTWLHGKTGEWAR